ncbi:MAG TPA: carboxypeptidase-like regulatory domain-containing protein, partial [Blastocatellia bacterium]|nr:carboxypeptidase-like regulatory domain-containing protein [Blastocatellia bacterium]
MKVTRVLVFLLPFSFFLIPCISLPTLAQSQTTGSIAGTVRDQTGAVIAGVAVTVVSRTTGEKRIVTTNDRGNYAVPLLPPDTYNVIIAANGFKQALIDNVLVAITETKSVNAEITVGDVKESVAIHATQPLIQNGGPQLGRVVDSRGVSELPLATRNFTQILALSPGVVLAPIDSTAVGSNSQSVSVNGARVSQNNYQINGVDANNFATNNALYLAVPAPETIQEFKVQTSLYDATFGNSG